MASAASEGTRGFLGLSLYLGGSHSFCTILVVVFHAPPLGPVRVDSPERLQHCPAHITLVVLFFLMILPSTHHAVSWSCLKLVLGQRGRLIVTLPLFAG